MKKSENFYNDEQRKQAQERAARARNALIKGKCNHPMEKTTQMFNHMDGPEGWRCNACGYQEWYR